MGWIYKLVKLSPHVSLLISSIPKLWDINRTKEVIVDKFSKDREVFNLLQNRLFYSAIHKAAGSLVTGRSQKELPKGTTPTGHSSIDGFMVGMVEQWNSTSQIMEQP